MHENGRVLRDVNFICMLPRAKGGGGKGVKKKADASAIAMFGQRSAPNGTHCLSPSQ